MQPYDAKRPCPKCGGSDSTLEYRCDNRPAQDQWYRDHPGEGPIMPGTAVSRALKPEEYLQRRCTACKYPWREACLQEAPQPTTRHCYICQAKLTDPDSKFISLDHGLTSHSACDQCCRYINSMRAVGCGR